MKITMTTPMEGDRVSRRRGDELDLDNDEAQRLIDADFATRGWLSEARTAPIETPAAPPSPPPVAIPDMHPNDVAPIDALSEPPVAPVAPVAPPAKPKAAAPAKRARG